MGDRCKNCKKCERCENGAKRRKCTGCCDKRWSCTCPCNVGSDIDVIQKVGAIGLGTAATVGGMALTVMTSGLALPLAGGAIAGAGMSSAVNGMVKTVKNEKISGSEYLADVAIGGATGVVGGVGGQLTESAARAAVTNVAREGCKRGAIKLGVRTVGGAITGLAKSATGEAGKCAAGQKEWEDFGDDPESFAVGMAVGAGVGAVSHLTSNTCKLYPSEKARKLTKVMHKTTTTAAEAGAKRRKSTKRKKD